LLKAATMKKNNKCGCVVWGWEEEIIETAD
jgi:hypothetical protein